MQVKSITDTPESINISTYVHIGEMMYLREGLPISHPEYPYNYLKDKLGVEPELYGIYHPFVEKYKDYTREQLLSVVSNLHQQLENAYHYL